MGEKIKTLGVIPARYGSSRLPGKPLALIQGKPMIQWVYESCTGTFDRLVVATDDIRIMDVVAGFKGNSFMTSESHHSGTERCAEIVEILKQENFMPDIVVNIQGDEPLIKREQLTLLLTAIIEKNAEIATLATMVGNNEEASNPNVVKVVTDKDNHALYFSRQSIPFYRDHREGGNKHFLQHIGLYAYRTDILRQIVKLPPSQLEMAESLEQLRWLEHGYKITVQLSTYKNIGVDTPEDLKKIEEILNQMGG